MSFKWYTVKGRIKQYSVETRYRHYRSKRKSRTGPISGRTFWGHTTWN